MVLTGIDQINSISWKLKDKNVGIITNNMARNRELVSSLDVIKSLNNVRSLTLLSPEHGFFGDLQAGIPVESYFDDYLNVYVESLYKNPGNVDNNDIDSSMREMDSKRDKSKYPDKSIMEKFDAIIYDLQDVGCRIYTYLATMIYSMESLNDNGTEFIVLDRPNPITGLNPEGPILDGGLESFIGAMPLPMRHSLTIGEAALFFNKYINKERTNLNIVKVKNWRRSLWHDETGQPWIMPSPNMPDLDTAIVYPGSVLIEGTNLSEGRGTTRPFQILGAPWIDGVKLSKKINDLKIPGVKVIDVKFIPSFSKYSGMKCSGIYIYVNNRDLFRPFRFALEVISEIIDVYKDFEFYDKYFDSASGNRMVRSMLLKGYSGNDIVERFDLNRFNIDADEIKIYN
ncbi:exo-beta-N-acetylmuramidase NamZ family protein [Picrophilus oshimae]|uniref:Uncharacterized conserved protein YbbC, DUF1343 family n=1 Tax=Picrophilus torridus (strain ATCC 700027 / DSM 9790 / JCM 10055 / NBRC 100828 / KAW 2/3) TaxID=1122961 RepID=A0A8G2L8G2_PICTO|nr:DUF1343 domain-containing protein [Picrophilus oshimae]SMD31410.1 Uncharacterized conserved protein YbbC, DUF1343 family [Picrophilus oshimae DSM 9789]